MTAPDPDSPSSSLPSEPAPETAPEQASSASGHPRRSFLRNTGLAALAAGAASLPGVTANAKDPAGAPPPSGQLPPSGEPAYGVEPGGEASLPSLKQRVLALKGLLIQKGVLSEERITGFVAYYEKFVGPHLGAAAVAHAWVNPEFRTRLLTPPADQPFQATAALRDFLFGTTNPDTGRPYLAPELTLGTAIGPEGEFLRIVENGVQSTGPDKGSRVHNIVACTVCSCYPQALLGVQPTWYKSQQYRSRVINDPLGVVDEFMEDLIAGDTKKWAVYKAYRDGLDEIRTWDSNSEVRFFVIPEQPPSWRGLGESELRRRITRNAMLGAEILLP
jgi:nitrile hydratase